MAKYALARLRNSIPEDKPVTEVNIIPVIDISLVLLVIMFVSAPMLSYPNLPVELPKASEPEGQDRIVAITCTLKGDIGVGSIESTWDKLPADLKAEIEHAPDAPVVLRVDKGVPYRTVEKLIAAAKNAGAKKIALGTDTFK